MAFSWAYSKWCITSACIQSSGRINYVFVRQPALFRNEAIQKAIQNPFLHFGTCLFSWNPMNPEYSESENDREKLKVRLPYHGTKDWNFSYLMVWWYMCYSFFHFFFFFFWCVVLFIFVVVFSLGIYYLTILNNNSQKSPGI